MASLLARDAVPSGSLSADLGLYVHWPFCHAKCHFCDFATAVGAENRVEPYLKALTKEASTRGSGQISTLFIGGGTPTAILPTQVHLLFSALRSSFDFSTLTEASVEANPESASEDVLRAYQQEGINRISFGLQATQPALLNSLGRLHTHDDFVRAYERARNLGFANISVDLMYGLPDQSLLDWRETLSVVVGLKPEHISAYALKVEPRTRFGTKGVQPDDDLEADLYLEASSTLTAAGYRHYEISNFARPGYESKHNLRYWRNEPTLGLGLSAASYVDGVRSKNTSVLTDYINQWEKGTGDQIEKISLAQEEREKESVMLHLRLDDGVAEETIERINVPMFGQFLDHGLARVEAGRYRLTPQGWLLSNQLFQTLI